MATYENILSIKGLDAGYGENPVNRGISFSVQSAEVVGLLGANGAGKTTLLNVISGFIKPTAGSILFEQASLIGRRPDQVAGLGVIQVSQFMDLFLDMSVEDNLRLGATCARGRAETGRGALDAVFKSFPRLAERRSQKVGTLSGGERRMVAIGRSMMGQPKLLLLDEPSGGLSPQFVAEIGSICSRLKEQGATMLIVEQNFDLVFKVADRIMVMREGEIVYDDTAVATRENFNDHELARFVYL
ncbi:ABC transporter ATP-binding protein [Castellaniella sp. GW247-6E4]|uniref:ABC transporter ATP-binding protein n=1 Tax=Castellaniella sp. GW247-6E4 TaxID=3140380 RepID=UPI0033151284